MILNYHWFGTFFVTLGAYFCLLWLQDGSRLGACGLGCCGALSFWSLQSDGAVMALATVALGVRFRPKLFPWVVGAGLGASLLLWLPMLPWREAIWDENFHALGRHLASRNSHFAWGTLTAMLSSYLQEPANLGFLSRILLTLERYYAFYPILLAGLMVAELRRDRQLAVLTFFALGYALVTHSRQTVPYFGYCGPLFLLIACCLFSRFPSGRLPKIVAALTIFQFGLIWLDLRGRFTLPVQTRSGVYWSENRVEAALMAYAHSWVQTYTRPNMPVFAYPYFTSLYTTEFLVNPTREALFVEGVFPIERMRACKQSLREKQVELVFVQPLVGEAVAAVCSLSVEEFQRVSEQWKTELLEDYSLFQSQGMLSLYRRRFDNSGQRR